MRKDLCSITIAKMLDTLGFNRKTCYYYHPRLNSILGDPDGRIKDWNHYLRPPLFYVSVPTVDQAIDWIREKYDVVVFNHVAPYVNPSDEKNRIIYIYNVKYCDRKNGYNSRVHISHGKCVSYNIYTAKRMTIMKAIRWIKKNKTCSKKTKK